jgi:Pyridoxamine 5'-phosphate oxidase
MTPIAEQLQFPHGYGRPSVLLPWPAVRSRLERAKQYWLATARPDGRPHVVPVDGLWLDDVWHYGGSAETLHRRTIAANPQAVMHLPDPWEVVVVEGQVRSTNPTAELAQRLADASNEKYADYGYDLDASAYQDSLSLVPRRVIAWTSFPKDATRFRFE